MIYKEELTKAMEMLSQDKRVIFLGQNTNYGDHSYGTLRNIPENKIIEMPIAEDMQMGVSLGLSLEGYIPVTIYDRMDFLILSMNQLLNHIDKVEEMSKGIFKPIIIIRTIIGPKTPLYPGPQHCQDYTEMLKIALTNINIVKLDTNSDIMNEYKKALSSDKSTLFVEVRELYHKDMKN